MLETRLQPSAFDAFEFFLDHGGLFGIPRVIPRWVLPVFSLGFLWGGFSPFRVWGVVFPFVSMFMFVLMFVGTAVLLMVFVFFFIFQFFFVLLFFGF